MTYSLKINGFRNMNEVKAFINWYEGQGEQGASIWFHEDVLQGNMDRDFIGIDTSKPYEVKDENTLIVCVNE